MHTSDLMDRIRSPMWVFCIVADRVFLSVRDQARDPRTSVSRDAKRDAPVSRLCSLGERPRKAGGVRAFWLPLVFFHPHSRSRWNLVSRDVGRVPFPQKKKRGGSDRIDALCKNALSFQTTHKITEFHALLNRGQALNAYEAKMHLDNGTLDFGHGLDFESGKRKGGKETADAD